MAEAHFARGSTPAFKGYTPEEEEELETFSRKQLKCLSIKHRAFISQALRGVATGAVPTTSPPPTPTPQQVEEEAWGLWVDGDVALEEMEEEPWDDGADWRIPADL